MELYSSNDSYKLYHGNMLDMLEVIEPNSIDSIVTDPPYELNFMGKSWDNSGIAFQKETWEKCYQVLKPGGYLLAFGGSRTYHHIACAIENAGFEIRDCIMYLYGSGFPKSLNIGLAIDKKNGVESKIVGYNNETMPDFRDVGEKQKQLSGIDKLTFGQIENSERKQYPIYEAQNEWNGWGSCLKPAYEPIVVARKPFESSLVENVLKWRVGGLNIDECRVGVDGGVKKVNIIPDSASKNSGFGCDGDLIDLGKGRFPANVIHDGSDEAISGMPNTKSTYNIESKHETEIHRENADFLKYGYKERYDSGFNDEGNASRYFYCAKASKKDRDEGLDEFEEKLKYVDEGKRKENGKSAFESSTTTARNFHPTVKNVELMQYLVRLVSPKGATILDCFNGSGSTGKAVMYENVERNKEYKYIGIELTNEYLPISKARIEYAYNLRTNVSIDINDEKVEKASKKLGQVDMFEFV